jgi:hypothetical protein
MAPRAWPSVLLLLLLLPASNSLFESGATVLTRRQPWQHLSRFSFTAGAEGTISGVVTRLGETKRSVYLYCEWELEKIHALREDLNLEPGSLEECEELTRPGLFLATAELEPAPPDGSAEFSLTVPVHKQERVCTVALADCTLARKSEVEPKGKAGMFRSRQGLTDMMLHYMTGGPVGVMPPIAGLGVFGLVPGIVSGFLSTAQADKVLQLTGHFMSDSFKNGLAWSPHGYKLHFENGGSHLPAEEAWLPEMYLVLAVALLCYVPVYRGMIKQHQLVGKSRDHITLWVTLVLACQIFHVASEEIHLLSIQFYGEGWRTLDWLSHMCLWVAQFGLAALLVMLGWGWTLTPGTLVLNKFIGGKKLCGIGPAGVLMIAGSIEALLALNAKIFRHAGFGLHHDFESWPGILLVAFRLLVLVLLLVGVQRQIADSITASQQPGAHDGIQLREFLHKLRLWGGLYMIALPLAVALAALVSPAWRHRVISLMVSATQSIALVSITRLLYGRSLYFKLAAAALQESGADGSASMAEGGAAVFHTE